MSGREAILAKVRASLKARPDDAARLAEVERRMAMPVRGVIPARGQLEPKARVDLFAYMAEKFSATVARVPDSAAVPEAVAAYLRARNLPAAIRIGADARLAGMPWDGQGAMDIRTGPSDGNDEAGVSHAFGAVAETGTLVLVSGSDNPTTISFLPEHHIVVLDARDVEGDFEAVLAKVRSAYGAGQMPRTVNLITGPSRSGDIEQKIILGAHGPRALHIVVVEA